MSRGKSLFTEDVALARAVVHVSHHPKKGADQKASAYWNLVLKQFLVLSKYLALSHQEERVRASVACKDSWKTLQTKISKFIGNYTTVINAEKSGYQEQDYIDNAVNSFQEIEHESFSHLEI